MNNELKLSVSKVKTFLSCKKKYKYTYIDKLPQKEFDFYILGKFCHKVLEDFHITYINGSTELFNSVMSKVFKQASREFVMSKEMKKECWDIIDKYLRLIIKNKIDNIYPNIIACEKNFNFIVDKNISLNGMIDRIQIDNDGVLHVGDYKTTKNKKYLQNDKFQLLTYAYYLVTQDNLDLDKIRASYILLRHNFEHITFDFKIDEILKIKDMYIEYANAILSETEFNPTVSKLCEYCGFCNICPDAQKYANVFNGEVSWID